MNIKWYSKIHVGGFKRKSLVYFSKSGVYIPVDIVEAYGLNKYSNGVVGVTENGNVAIMFTDKKIKNTNNYTLSNKVFNSGGVAIHIGCTSFVAENSLSGSRVNVLESEHTKEGLILVMEHA